MKNLRTAITAIALTLVLSSSAMAGNIALRNNASSTEAIQANATGNIALRGETSALGQLAILVKGNIGLIVSVLMP